MKTTTYRHLLMAAMLMMGGAAMAQNLNSAYFTEDMYYRHTLNPAFGDSLNYVAIPGLGNLQVNLRGNFGYQDVVMKNPIPGGKRMTTFLNPYISASDALDGFNSTNRISGDVDVTILSAGFKAWGGYNTISLSARTQMGVKLPYELFEFAKNTGNQTYHIGDISAQARSYVELALGHSRQINERLRLGAKLKFLFGAANADLEMTDVVADLSNTQVDATGHPMWLVSGKGKAQMSMKGFYYKSKESKYNDPNYVGPDGKPGRYTHVDDVDVDGAGLGGFGMAIDLGGEYKINDDWKVSAALLDLGFIFWNNNVVAANNGKAFVFGGFTDMTVGSESDNTIDNELDYYGDQFTDFINLQDQGDQGGRTTMLAATLNLGAEYTLPMYRKLSFGALSSTRINGKYSWTEGRVSANWKPLRWLDGGVNFAVNTFTTSAGWILNIHPKGYNFFVGMDHILGKTSKEFIPLSSNASVALGMNITFGSNKTAAERQAEKEAKAAKKAAKAAEKKQKENAKAAKKAADKAPEEAPQA